MMAAGRIVVMFPSVMSKLVPRTICRPSSSSNCIRHFRSSRTALMADSENEGVTDMRQWIKPTDFQKLVLVIGKAYKRKADIPDRVSQRQMTKAFDIFRGRTMVGMLLFGFAGAYVAILLGRDLRDSGDSMTKRGTAMENAWREKGRLEREARNANDQQ